MNSLNIVNSVLIYKLQNFSHSYTQALTWQGTTKRFINLLNLYKKFYGFTPHAFSDTRKWVQKCT